MKTYLLKRLLVAIPSLVIASVIVFTLPRLLPGDAVQLMVEEKAYGKDIDDLRAKLGLDKPIYVQFYRWFTGVLRGDFGQSIFFHTPVLKVIRERAEVSLFIAVLSMALIIVSGIPIGVISAVWYNSYTDQTARGLDAGRRCRPWRA
jgi:peptide/nickel transport system permease protein